MHGRAKLLGSFVLALVITMKSSSLLLLPVLALFFSACAGPGGPGYSDYGPGPNPRAGYYWNGTIYVEGDNPSYHNHHHDDQYDRRVTDENDVNINRTNVNERTVNRTNVNDTRVNDRNVNQRNVNRNNVKQSNAHGQQAEVQGQKTDSHKKNHKPNPDDQRNQPGNQ